MSSVNVERSDRNTKIIDKLYKKELVVSTQDYDLAISFFKGVMADPDMATHFAATLFQIAQDTGIAARTFLENIKNQNAMELNATFSYYLNGARSNSTLLGISSIITSNYYAARNVVA